MKKVFLSMATLAMVAVGTVSCGSDDSPAPQPDPSLTENFIQVNDDQSEITYSIYAVHTDGAGNNAPIKEYTIEGTVYAAFEFISHDGSSATTLSGTDNTWVTLLTKVNTDKTVESGERYVFPYEVQGTTALGGFSTTMNGTNYDFADGATFDLTDLNYGSETQDGKMTYDLKGNDQTDASIKLRTNLDGKIDGLYSLNASQGKGLSVNKNAKLSVRTSLN